MSCINQAVKEPLRNERATICLDAGCGTGMSTIALSKYCDFIIAVDYSYESLKVLKNKFLSSKGAVIPVHADITHLPFRDDSFDITICTNTLQHLRPGEPQTQAIQELRRLTKYQGKLAVSVHHYSKPKQDHGWIKEGRPGQAGIDYIFRFSRDDLANLMPGAIIRGVGFYGLSRIPFLGNRLQNLVARILGRIAAYLGYGHMLVAIQRNSKGNICCQ
jgi:SAM-dependent methyltransferase